jgi:hypothetical protein
VHPQQLLSELGLELPPGAGMVRAVVGGGPLRALADARPDLPLGILGLHPHLETPLTVGPKKHRNLGILPAGQVQEIAELAVAVLGVSVSEVMVRPEQEHGLARLQPLEDGLTVGRPCLLICGVNAHRKPPGRRNE